MMILNLQSLKTQFIAQVDAKPTIKYVLLFQLIGFVVALISPLSDLLVLVPNNLLHLHLWRLVSNILVENNLIVIAWSVYCFYQYLMYIQPNWPWEETVKFAIIVQLSTNFLLVLCTLLIYITTGVLYPFYEAQIYGSSALAMAALIALKQYLPDTVLLTTPFGRLKNCHLPMTLLTASVLFWPFGLLRGTVPFQLGLALQISWTYLRFFQSRGGLYESMGDRSEHFTWASLFPRRLQPMATAIGRLTFRLLHRLGVLKRLIRREDLDFMEEQNMQQMESLESVKVADAVLAPESWDVERKRQKALRMLNQRLAKDKEQQQQLVMEPKPNVEQIGRSTASSTDAQLQLVGVEGGAGAGDAPPEVQFYLDQRSSSEREGSVQPGHGPLSVASSEEQ